jgi:ribose/xylose/arabinose/galactoside ABC-type transport system permease subunit
MTRWLKPIRSESLVLLITVFVLSVVIAGIAGYIYSKNSKKGDNKG